MAYGDDKTQPPDEQRPLVSEQRFRQSQSGSLTPSAQDPEGSGENGARGRSLENRRQDVGRRDDLGGPESPRTPELDRETAALEALEINLSSDWSGPLPPPSILLQYEQVLEGAASRIFSMAEVAATGQSKREDKLVEAEIERASTGQAVASVVTFVAVIASITFFAFGQVIAGGALLSFPVIMLVRAFLTRQ